MENLLSCLGHSDHAESALKSLFVILSEGGEKCTSLKRLMVTEGIVQHLVELLKTSWGSHSSFRTKSSGLTTTSEEDPTQREKDTLVSVLTLGCIYHICDGLPQNLCSKFVDDNVILTLLSCIIPWGTNHLFEYGVNYETCVRDALAACARDGHTGRVMVSFEEDEKLDVKSQEESADTHLGTPLQSSTESELQFYDPIYQSVTGTPAKVKVKPCEVLIPSEAGEISLRDFVISKGVAWPNKKMAVKTEQTKASKPNPKQDQSKFVEAKITHFLKGNFFWMIAGKESIFQAEQISKGLARHERQLASMKPKKLDVVTAKINGCGWRLVRARVLDERDGTYTVQDLDSGRTHQVSLRELYNLPSSYNLAKLPPLATLASLKGICPVPRDARLPELALGALRSIVQNNCVDAVNILCQSDLIGALPGLINCPDRNVAYRALDLTVGLMTYTTKAVMSKPWHCLIPDALNVLNQCIQISIKNRNIINTQKSQPAVPNQNTASTERSGVLCSKADISEDNTRLKALAESSIACLANTLYLSTKAKSVFHENRGLDLVIRAFIVYYNQEIIKTLCIKTLANYVYFTPASDRRTSGPRYKRVHQSSRASPTKPSKPGKPQAAVSGQGGGSSSNDESDTDDVNPDDPLAGSFSGLDIHGSDSFIEEGRFYIRGDKLQFEHDETHELQRSAKLVQSDFSAIICGMLNTGRMGTIYLGLDPKDSSVVGVEMDHNARDEMRMSVDDLMIRSLSPAILHLQLHMEFVPVVEIPARKDGNSEGASVVSGEDQNSSSVFHVGHDYVVEIQVKPLPNIIYSCKGDECFYRLGQKTVALDSQLIRQVIVLEEETKFVEEIVLLQQELELLRFEAANLQSLSSTSQSQ